MTVSFWLEGQATTLIFSWYIPASVIFAIQIDDSMLDYLLIVLGFTLLLTVS